MGLVIVFNASQGAKVQQGYASRSWALSLLLLAVVSLGASAAPRDPRSAAALGEGKHMLLGFQKS